MTFGSNAGHCKPDQWRGFSKYAAKFGAQMALDIIDNEWETFENLIRYIKEKDLQCDLWQGDTVRSAL